MGILTLLSDDNLFNPRRLFLASTIGAIYDYDDYAYLYQKSDGSTPVNELEQPVGLMLDKRYGGLEAIGSERVTNGGFDADASWTKGTGWAITGGAAVKTAGVSDLLQQTSVIPTSGWCRVSFTATRTAGTCYVRLGGNTNQYSIVQSGSYAIFLPVQGVDQTLRFVAEASFAGSIDDVSVKQLPGLHAYQSTDAARPVISARYNLLVGTATLSTQFVTTLAASYTLTFTGSGTVTLSGTATGVKSAGTNVFTATAGTLTLTVSGSVTLADLRLTADANSRLPAYQRVTTATDYDSSGFPRFLRIDATDDFMRTATVDPGTDKVFVCAGVTKMSDAAFGTVIEFSTSPWSVAGSFGLFASVNNAANYLFRSGGTTPGIGETRTGFTAPHTAVVSGIASISGPYVATRVNGTDGTPVTTSQGTGNYTAQTIYIGSRAGITARLRNGRIYPMVICFKAVTAGEIAATEAWVNQRTKAYA